MLSSVKSQSSGYFDIFKNIVNSPSHQQAVFWVIMGTSLLLAIASTVLITRCCSTKCSDTSVFCCGGKGTGV